MYSENEYCFNLISANQNNTDGNINIKNLYNICEYIIMLDINTYINTDEFQYFT